MSKTYGNINQCYEEAESISRLDGEYGSAKQVRDNAKMVLDFIAANPLIQKMADAAEADEDAAEGYMLASESRLPWSLLLKWNDGPLYLLTGTEDDWSVEEWTTDARDTGTDIVLWTRIAF